jgi:hypothetical protein
MIRPTFDAEKMASRIKVRRSSEFSQFSTTSKMFDQRHKTRKRLSKVSPSYARLEQNIFESIAIENGHVEVSGAWKFPPRLGRSALGYTYIIKKKRRFAKQTVASLSVSKL